MILLHALVAALRRRKRSLLGELETVSADVRRLRGAPYRGEVAEIRRFAVPIEPAARPLGALGYTLAALLAARLHVNLRKVQRAAGLATLRSRLNDLTSSRDLHRRARRCFDAVDKALVAEVALRAMHATCSKMKLLVANAALCESSVGQADQGAELARALQGVAGEAGHAYGIRSPPWRYGPSKAVCRLTKDAIGGLVGKEEPGSGTIREVVRQLLTRELQRLGVPTRGPADGKPGMWWQI